MSRNKQYWNKRITAQSERMAEKTHKEIQKQLAKDYKAVLKDLDIKITDLYLRITNDDGTLNMNEFYKFTRYFKLRKELQEALNEMGEKQIAMLNDKIKNTYDYSKTLITDSFITLKIKGADKTVINSLMGADNIWSKLVWCPDGKSGEERIAKNMLKLQKTVEKGLIDCVTRGASKDELVKELIKCFDVSFNSADKLARTELTYIQNKAKVDTYKEYGIEQYEYVATEDDRVSEECEELNGQIFNLSDAVVGVNYPPMHTNCRCTTIPVI